MKLCIFEDNEYYKFEPLVFNRPVFDLRLGSFSLREIIAKKMNFDTYSLWCRDSLKDTLLCQNTAIKINKFEDDDYLFINARINPYSDLLNNLTSEVERDIIFTNNEVILGAYLTRNFVKKNFQKPASFNKELFQSLPSKNLEIDYFTYLWDLIYKNDLAISQDYEIFFNQTSTNQEIRENKSLYFLDRDSTLIAKSAKLGLNVVLDSSNGPVIIDDNANVMHNVVIYGPCYIGKNSLVKSNSTIYGGTTIGNFCKVAGEVSNSIFMDYSNKQHDGFLGHSYLGSWVNLGAGTITSNLKNNYSKIQVELSFGKVQTDLQFLGLLIGDHSKSAIGTRFNTSTVVGFSSNIFGSGFTEKFIPSFAWGSIDSKDVYQLDKAVNVAKIVYARRNTEFSEKDYKLFLNVFNETVSIREKYGYK
jgi:UDP-N-acetylglucosamine diphosphorylase/glucosamine-1-phosphate N-acetyltransferase